MIKAKETVISIPPALNDDYDPQMFNEAVINKKIDSAPALPSIQGDMRGNPIYHIKSKKVRRAGAELNLSVEYLREIQKCRDDIFYFSQNYFYIKVSDSPKLVKIPLRKYQKQMLYNLQNYYRNIFCCARQIGKCITGDTVITIKKKNKIYNLTIEDFYKNLRFKFYMKIFAPLLTLFLIGAILWLMITPF